METQYEFRATKRQYKTRISQWHLDKNVKDGEMQYIAQKQKTRKVLEDKDTAFRVRSRPVESEKITRTVKRKKISEDALLVAPSPPTQFRYIRELTGLLWAQSPSSFWNTLHETVELGTTSVPDFEYHLETGETKLAKLVQLIKDSEESADIDYMKTMLEVNSLVYDLIVEDEPKFDVLFEETPNANLSMCYICSGVNHIGKDQMAQKVESERLLLEAIAISMSRFGEDTKATLHFKYNLLLLYRDWSCRLDYLPILVGQIVELALNKKPIDTYAPRLLWLISSVAFKDPVYCCGSCGSAEYPACLGHLPSLLQGLSISSDQVVRDLQSKIWDMSIRIGSRFMICGARKAIVPLINLIMQLEFTLANVSSSVHFWTSVFILAISHHSEPLFNSRQLIFQAFIQASRPYPTDIDEVLSRLANKSFQEVEYTLISELEVRLIEISLEEIEILGDFRNLYCALEFLNIFEVLGALEKLANFGNPLIFTLLTELFGHIEVEGFYEWREVINLAGQVAEIGLDSSRALLCIAARNGHESAARALIDAGACIDGPLEANPTPIEYAAEAGYGSIVGLLMEEGARLSHTVMDNVIHSSDQNLFEIWMNRVFERDQWSSIFDAILHIESYRKYDLYVKIYERIRGELEDRERNASPKNGLSSLVVMIKDFRKGFRDALRRPLSQCSGPGLELLLNSLTGLHVEQQGRYVLGRALLGFSDDPSCKLPTHDESSSMPIMHLFVSRNAPNALSVFLALGADTTITDEQGNTALHTAAASNRSACAAHLLKYGIEVEARNSLGQTAFGIALKQGHQAFLEKLAPVY